MRKPRGCSTSPTSTWVSPTEVLRPQGHLGRLHADEFLAEAESRVMEKIKLDGPEAEKRKHRARGGRRRDKVLVSCAHLREAHHIQVGIALSMEGNSGPYIQYAYVRTNGILAKAKEKPSAQEVKLNPSEKALIRKMALFRDAAEKGPASARRTTSRSTR